MREYEQAKAKAARLAKSIGGGFRPRIDEKLGWHHGAISACGRIYVTGEPGRHTAFFGDPYSYSGRWIATDRNARRAVVRVIERAMAETHKDHSCVKQTYIAFMLGEDHETV